MSWQAPAEGFSLSPPLELRAGEPGEVVLEISVGTELTARRTVALHAPAPAPPARRGRGVAYLGPEESPTRRGLAAAGLNLPRVDAPAQSELSAYAGLLVAGDCWGSPTVDLPRAAPKLVEFVRAGGRLAVWQLNDSDWRPGYLPADLFVLDPDTTVGQVTMAQHPLFTTPNTVGAVTGAKCYDRLGPVGAPWKVLATDADGGPAVVEAEVGRGWVLVIEPSFDRYAAGEGDAPDEVVTAATGRALLQNLVAWLGAD